MRQMTARKPALATVILVISTTILAIKLLAPRPIQIVLGEEQAILLEGAIYFTFTDAILIAISAWFGGTAAFYLLLHERVEGVPANKKSDIAPLALKLLGGDERKLYKHISDSGGEILQKDLILETGLDKAKVTRLLNKLEQKGLILRIKHGMTNRIVLKDPL